MITSKCLLTVVLYFSIRGFFNISHQNKSPSLEIAQESKILEQVSEADANNTWKSFDKILIISVELLYLIFELRVERKEDLIKDLKEPVDKEAENRYAQEKEGRLGVGIFILSPVGSAVLEGLTDEVKDG